MKFLEKLFFSVAVMPGFTLSYLLLPNLVIFYGF